MSFIWKMEQKERYKIIIINKLTLRYYGNIEDLNMLLSKINITIITFEKKRFIKTLLPMKSI